MSAPRIVLASTSRYRAELLGRLIDDFDTVAPGVEETAVAGEAPGRRARRLAIAKAEAAAGSRGNALVIGSDQVAERDGLVLDKPGNAETACAQLAACAGRQVRFHTALCLIDTRTKRRQVHVDRTVVQFRALDRDEIVRYVQREQPFDCAGSFKCEGLGISLFERIVSRDPTALIGLPLIALARLLRQAGAAIP